MSFDLRRQAVEHDQGSLPLAIPDRHVPGPGRVDLPGPLRLGVDAVPGFADSPIRVRGADGTWRAVRLSAGLTERMERASGVRRGLSADLTRSMHRRRWREPRAFLPAEAQIAGCAAKYRVPFRVAKAVARQCARDIPPSATRAGKRAIQSARGLISGAARRAACYPRDRSIVALLAIPGATVRSVARHLGVSVRAVATARERLDRTMDVDERRFREGRRAARRAVKGWWRAHYRACTDAGCACRDYQARQPAADGKPWRFPLRGRGRTDASPRPRQPADPRTLPPDLLLRSGERTGASAGAAGRPSDGAPVLQPGEGWRRLVATVERIRRERPGRGRRPRR